MDSKEILELLREKLDRNMELFQKEWLQMPPSALVDIALEIANTQSAYQELRQGEYPIEYLEYLLRFDNPLEVVRDQMQDEMEIEWNDLSHLLWELSDKRESESEYSLDPDHLPQDLDELENMDAPDQGVTMC